jgi:hypothetical protein
VNAVRFSLILVAACGRVDFATIPDNAVRDAQPDAVTGHDEDGDGIPDAIDPCPYTSGDLADQDGDGVGDACDPHPTTPGDHWVFFSPCTPDSPPPFALDAFTQGADSLESMGFAVEIPGPIAQTRIVAGFTIVQRLGDLQHQISLGGETVPFYFVELNDNNMDSSTDLGVVYANPMTNTYDQLAAVPLATDVHLGTGSIVFDVDGRDQQFRITAGWSGEQYTAGATVAGYITAPSARFQDNGLDLKLEYIAMITSP